MRHVNAATMKSTQDTIWNAMHKGTMPCAYCAQIRGVIDTMP